MGALHILLTLFVSLKLLASAQEINQFIYNGFQGANLSLSGIATIHPNGLLELTNTSYQMIGRAFFPLPFRFNTSSSNNFQSALSFSTNFVFAMVPELPTHGGHGIAFAISPSKLCVGSMATQYLGLLNSTTDGLSSNHLFAVELDSAKSPDLEDMNANHVGIDINSLKSNESAPVTYYLDKEGRNQTLELNSGDPMQVWIDYKEEEKLLNVTVAPIGVSKPSRPLLSKSLNLSQVLLESMYVGFSAATGSVSSRHYILGWSFNKSGESQTLDPSKLPSLPSLAKSRKLNQRLIILLAVTLTVTIIVMAVLGTMFIRRKRYEEIREDWEKAYGPQRFSYEVLYKATRGFRDKDLLGAGGFGKVYRGVLSSCNTQVAVKKISHNSAQGMKEFIAEIASMGRLRHRNLVQLLGYCRRKGELLLVYEYMPNGSLDKFLFSKKEAKLNWDQRHRIIRGVASGLLYLHHDWEQVVLHRDVKASNVLLDANFNARLGDFGLAKFYDHGTNPQTTCVVGTVGYLAPELIKTGKPTTSSDVFAFGNFMLEIACGRKPFEPKCLPEETILADWVLECWKRGDILSSSDPRLEGNYVVQEMELVLKLGLLCAHSTPAARPDMRQVVNYLDHNVSLPEISQYGGPAGSITVNNHDTFNSANSWSSTDSILTCGR
ncbi:L-type lectin-domain containing receptor kinase SIT2 [Ricinus communis]|uniref:L-type lectin-domain containing receptor kinase SIT2 n=1 Tax=Ricinus communis TaxID=3988 RepID=UPI00201AC336|nr:L-type lectin-domain containing receptor kinase SIT2 [Ricinus communis]